MSAQQDELLLKLSERGCEIAELCGIVADRLRDNPATNRAGWAVSAIGTLATVLADDISSAMTIK